MPLLPTSGPSKVDPLAGGWAFCMMNGGVEVRVLVTDEAIRDIAPATAVANTLEDHRGAFERLASEKFDRDELQDDGSVKISSSDLAAES